MKHVITSLLIDISIPSIINDCNLQKLLTFLKKVENDLCGFGRLDALNELFMILSL